MYITMCSSRHMLTNAPCRLSPSAPLTAPLTLSASDSIKISLTAKDGKTGARPHQAFLTLREQDTGLDESFPFSVKENGKAKIEVVRDEFSYEVEGSRN